MRSSAKAWVGLAAYVVVWDWICAPEEMLSEESLRFAKKHPLAAYAVVGSVGAHLIGWIPKRADPIAHFGSVLRRLKA